MADRTRDPGTYIGHEPELSSETLPGGIDRDDERIAGTATQSGGEGSADRRSDSTAPAAGHRQGPRASDDDVREAGQTG